MDRTATQGKSLYERVEEMEHRIVLFEELFHAFSSRLDKHFEKYDRLIGQQQKQIGELNSALTALAGDQVQSAKRIRDKVMASMASIPPHSTPTPTTSSTESGNTAVDDFSELINTHPRTESNPIAKKAGSKHHKASSKQNDAFTRPVVNDFKGMMSNSGVEQVLDVYKPAPGMFHHQPPVSVTVPAPLPPPHLPPHQEEYTAIAQPVQPPPPHQEEYATLPQPVHPPPHQEEYTVPVSDKRRKVVPDPKEQFDSNHPYQFQKNPQTVKEVWNEFIEGIDGQPSIKEMETIYQTTWRRDAATNKRFCRRKALWKAIEVGLMRGYTLEFVIDLLENTRYTDETKQSKHPIGWLSQSSNIPELLR